MTQHFFTMHKTQKDSHLILLFFVTLVYLSLTFIAQKLPGYYIYSLFSYSFHVLLLQVGGIGTVDCFLSFSEQILPDCSCLIDGVVDLNGGTWRQWS
jgi:hypothetical protein